MRVKAEIAVGVVVLEVVSTVVVSLATGIRAWWPWAILLAVTVGTCLLVWLKESQTDEVANEVNIVQEAGFGSVIDNSPVNVQHDRSRVSTSQLAKGWGSKIRDSSITVQK